MDAQRLFKSSLTRNERVAAQGCDFCGLVGLMAGPSEIGANKMQKFWDTKQRSNSANAGVVERDERA